MAGQAWPSGSPRLSGDASALNSGLTFLVGGGVPTQRPKIPQRQELLYHFKVVSPGGWVMNNESHSQMAGLLAAVGGGSNFLDFSTFDNRLGHAAHCRLDDEGQIVVKMIRAR